MFAGSDKLSGYFFLGYCLEQSTPRGRFQFTREDWVLLAPTNNDPYLIVIEKSALQTTRKKPTLTDSDSYFQFNGFEYNQTAEIPEIDFADFDLFDKATSVLYLSEKEHGGGDGEWCEYRHKYGATVYLYKNDDNSIYVIAGRNLTVTDRGIEN